jgi:hypothetical protein
VASAADVVETVVDDLTAEDDFGSTTWLLPSLMNIFSTSIPTVKRIPQKCRVTVSKAFTTLMRHCSISGSADYEMRAWKMQFMFAKCVLHQQPEIRGGKKEVKT